MKKCSRRGVPPIYGIFASGFFILPKPHGQLKSISRIAFPLSSKPQIGFPIISLPHFGQIFFSIISLFFVNTSGSPDRGIKLLTLVQDSSMEQKPGIVSAAKVQILNEFPKKKQEKLFLQYLFQLTCFNSDGHIRVISR